MRAFVVFESMFGNTEAVAKAIEEGLALYGAVERYEAGSAPGSIPAQVAILVVGGPTQGFSMSRPGTRQGAAKQATGPMPSTGIGIREWIERVDAHPDLSVAVFDTRFDKPPWLTGSAARAAMKRLVRRGLHLVSPPESFFVTSTQGPLKEGEIERARSWGEKLGAKVRGLPLHPASSGS